MPTTPDPKLAEIKALAARCVAVGDESITDEFTERFGVAPDAYLTLDESQQQARLAQMAVKAVKGGEKAAVDSLKTVKISQLQYVSRSLRPEESVHPYGVFETATGKRLHTGLQSLCNMMAEQLQNAYVAGLAAAGVTYQSEKDVVLRPYAEADFQAKESCYRYYRGTLERVYPLKLSKEPSGAVSLWFDRERGGRTQARLDDDIEHARLFAVLSDKDLVLKLDQQCGLAHGNEQESLRQASILLQQIQQLQNQVDALIRTALIQRETELRSPTADNSPSPGL